VGHLGEGERDVGGGRGAAGQPREREARHARVADRQVAPERHRNQVERGGVGRRLPDGPREPPWRLDQERRRVAQGRPCLGFDLFWGLGSGVWGLGSLRLASCMQSGTGRLATWHDGEDCGALAVGRGGGAERPA